MPPIDYRKIEHLRSSLVRRFLGISPAEGERSSGIVSGVPVTVLAALPLSEEQRAQIEACGDVEVTEVPPGPDPEDLEAMAETTEVWFGPRLRPHLIERAKRLKWVQLMSAGADRYLFPELVSSDIVLTNMRGLHADTIADHVLAFALAFSRDLPRFFRSQQERVWDRRQLKELAGTTMTIIGVGNIGAAVKRRGAACGMNVRGVVRRGRQIEGVEAMFTPERLLEAIKEVDWVVLACPLTTETFHLIGEEELRAMGAGSVLINVARGKVVDEEALVTALSQGWIAGAGLDVFEEEPLPADSPLWGLSNVLVTPHVSGSQSDYMGGATAIFCDNLRRYLTGQPLRNVVDKRLGY